VLACIASGFQFRIFSNLGAWTKLLLPFSWSADTADERIGTTLGGDVSVSELGSPMCGRRREPIVLRRAGLRPVHMFVAPEALHVGEARFAGNCEAVKKGSEVSHGELGRIAESFLERAATLCEEVGGTTWRCLSGTRRQSIDGEPKEACEDSCARSWAGGGGKYAGNRSVWRELQCGDQAENDRIRPRDEKWTGKSERVGGCRVERIGQNSAAAAKRNEAR